MDIESVEEFKREVLRWDSMGAAIDYHDLGEQDTIDPLNRLVDGLGDACAEAHRSTCEAEMLLYEDGE